MFMAAVTYTRKSVDTPFCLVPRETMNHIQKTYVAGGRLINGNETYSKDQLTVTHEFFWSSEADRNEFLKDPVVVKMTQDIDAYCKKNDISKTISVE